MASELLSNQSSQTACYGHKVERCYISNCAYAGIFIQTNGGLFSNNQIDSCAIGIMLNSDGTNGGYGASINLVSNNNVRMSMLYGIVLQSVNAGSNCTQNVVDGNIVSNSGQANQVGSSGAIYANIILMGQAIVSGTAGTQQNLISNNHLQGWMPRQPGNALYIDASSDYNFFHGNFLLSGAWAACNGHGATHNRMVDNFGYADYTAYNG